MTTQDTDNRTEIVALHNVTLRLPQSPNALLEDTSISIRKGDRIIISGASGSGKSTIIRAIGDIWDSGEGTIEIKADIDILVASQRAYAPNTLLAGVMCAPKPAGTYSDEAIAQALQAAGRGQMIQYVPGQSTAALVKAITDEGITGLDAMKARATKYIAENVSNLQTVRDQDFTYIMDTLRLNIHDTAALAHHIDEQYAVKLCERLKKWAVPGLISSYRNADGMTNALEARFIGHRLQKTLAKDIGNTLQSLWKPRRNRVTDWLGGAKPSLPQVRFIAGEMHKSIVEGLSVNHTANAGMNKLSRLFGTAATLLRLPGVLVRGAAYPFNWAAQEYAPANKPQMIAPLKLAAHVLCPAGKIVGGALWLASKPFDLAANLTTDLLVTPMKRTAPFGTAAGRGLSSAFNGVSFVLSFRRANKLARQTGKTLAHFAMNGELSQEIFTGRTMSQRLSGGEQQRIIFARALLQKPDLLILDEVTAALDRPAAIKLYDDLVKALPDTTIISIAHNEHVIAAHTQHAHLENKKLTIKPVAPQ